MLVPKFTGTVKLVKRRRWYLKMMITYWMMFLYRERRWYCLKCTVYLTILAAAWSTVVRHEYFQTSTSVRRWHWTIHSWWYVRNYHYWHSLLFTFCSLSQPESQVDDRVEQTRKQPAPTVRKVSLSQEYVVNICVSGKSHNSATFCRYGWWFVFDGQLNDFRSWSDILKCIRYFGIYSIKSTFFWWWFVWINNLLLLTSCVISPMIHK